jgi:hypothetical protein
MTDITVHYDVQTCDSKSFQGLKRFCNDDRTEISKKSIKSLLESIKYLNTKSPNTNNVIKIFGYACSQDLKDFIEQQKINYSNEKITIEIEHYNNLGIAKSIEHCYTWLQQEGKELAYQIQDDYLFSETAVFQCVDIFYQLHSKYKTQAVITPYNDPNYWHQYAGRATPRSFEPGWKNYWIQIYDTSCSFLTSHSQFNRHWDLYDKFFYYIDNKTVENNKTVLENKSLNLMFVERGVLGMAAVNSIAFHMQTELDRDPYVPWQPVWDSIDVVKN